MAANAPDPSKSTPGFGFSKKPEQKLPPTPRLTSAMRNSKRILSRTRSTRKNGLSKQVRTPAGRSLPYWKVPRVTPPRWSPTRFLTPDREEPPKPESKSKSPLPAPFSVSMRAKPRENPIRISMSNANRRKLFKMPGATRRRVELLRLMNKPGSSRRNIKVYTPARGNLAQPNTVARALQTLGLSQIATQFPEFRSVTHKQRLHKGMENKNRRRLTSVQARVAKKLKIYRKQIETAFKQRAFIEHPNRGGSKEKFNEISDAYTTLKSYF